VQAARQLLQSHGEMALIAHAHGAYAFPLALPCDIATIRVPTDRLSTQQLLWDAFHRLRVGGRCLIAGANNEGAKPAAAMLDTLFGTSRVEAQHSGNRLVVATKLDTSPASTDGFDSPFLAANVFHETTVRMAEQEWRLYTRPGVFSWEHLDEATTILAEVMEIRTGESVLDIGCGAGLPGLIAAQQSGTGRVVLLDADSEAVRGVARAIEHANLSNAEVLASDVTAAVGDAQFDVVITNPPFHQGKSVELALPRRFISESWDRLRPGGRLYLVANRTLPYEREIESRFGAVRVLHDGTRFKVLGATR
jgi:16S rRNA (guanine1207-N2)-methyltransferase